MADRRKGGNTGYIRHKKSRQIEIRDYEAVSFSDDVS